MPDPVVVIDSIVKRYGDIAALDGIDLIISPGEVLALLGSNGAGKTTLFDLIAGLRRPSAGRLAVFGHDPLFLPERLKPDLIFVPQEHAVPGWASPRDIARLYASLYPRFDEALLRRFLEDWDLPASNRLGEFSSGERRLAELALALCARPRLVVLDEPFANLDPLMRHGALEAITELREETGATILYSTHILSEVPRLARRVVILRAGSVAMDGAAVDAESLEALFMRHYGLEDHAPAAPGAPAPPATAPPERRTPG